LQKQNIWETIQITKYTLNTNAISEEQCTNTETMSLYNKSYSLHKISQIHYNKSIKVQIVNSVYNIQNIN